MDTVAYRYEGKKGKRRQLRENSEYLVVRTRSRSTLRDCSLRPESHSAISHFTLVNCFVEAGVELLRCTVRSRAKKLRDDARKALKKDPMIRFAGRVLADPESKEPVLYTENLFVKFNDGAESTACLKIIENYGLSMKQTLTYALNSFFVGGPEDCGRTIFTLAEQLLKEDLVELCHPELVRQSRQRAAFPLQWHLMKTEIGGVVVDQHAHVKDAWEMTQGEGTVIAVIDDGVDISHEEFAGSDKIVSPLDATLNTDNPNPKSGNDRHGTACAGVACANGNHNAAGVAPRARLMPIRLMSGLGSQAEANAFFHAAKNGADVISCSWGPPDGDFRNPNDPLHHQVTPLPDSTRLAIDWAVTNGRNGKGCIITWASGNGNESVDNDGYASYEKVIAVAASNDVGKKAPYSDFGKAVWCAFPSNHYFASVTKGIWTTDRMGSLGYNWGFADLGDAAGNYTNSFGGTSSACPGAAGVAALVVARNPELDWSQVKEVLKQCCDRIDSDEGAYDADGHSDWYGYGRLNARRAVELARPVPSAESAYTAIHKAIQDVSIRDLNTAKLSVTVGDRKNLKDLKVTVDIEHSWVGDLAISLKPPPGTGIAAVLLQKHGGAGVQNLKKTFSLATTPELDELIGKKPQGTWTLIVLDQQEQDTGKIISFALEMAF